MERMNTMGRIRRIAGRIGVGNALDGKCGPKKKFRIPTAVQIRKTKENMEIGDP